MLVTDADIAQIVQWGMEGAPDEVCGILLTRANDGPRLLRVANSAPDPRRNTMMLTDDILDALIEVVGPPALYEGDVSKELVMWHTHPGGLVGPSKDDMKYRKKLGDTRCLVVTIPSGEATEF